MDSALSKRPAQRGHRRGGQGDDRRRALDRGARDLQPSPWCRHAPSARPSTSARASSPTAPATMKTTSCCRSSKGSRYGCGDVIIGLNPASDDVETIVQLEDLLRRVVERLQLPTRYCVLSDIVKQTRARERVPVDVGFQSLAGTSKALAGMVGLDVDGILDLARGFDGLLLRDGTGIGGHQRRRRRRRHGDARSPRVRRRPAHSGGDRRVDDRQRRRRIHRPRGVQDGGAAASGRVSRTS